MLLWDAELADFQEGERIRRGLPITHQDTLVEAAVVPANPSIERSSRPAHQGLCCYCGELTLRARSVCRDHRDLVALDPSSSHLTRTPTVKRRNP